MAGKTISVWLTANEAERFDTLANKQGLTIGAFLKRCTDQALTPVDASEDFNALAADLRADLNKALARMTEVNTLKAQSEQERLREMITGLMIDLREKQIDIFKTAVGVSAQPAAKPPRRSDLPPSTRKQPPL